MLSRITHLFGDIYISLKNWGVGLNNKGYHNPYATFLIVAINTAIYFGGLSWSYSLSDILRQPSSLILYQFSHSSFSHLFGNMMFLILFGPAVEKYLGYFRYLSIYIICGIMAGFGFSVIHPLDGLVGASGSISGIVALYPFVHKAFLKKVLASVLCLTYFYLQLVDTIRSSIIPTQIAYLAHVLGAMTAIITFYMFYKNSCKSNKASVAF